MTQLTSSDLFSLEEYSEIRPEFRSRVMAHKKNRRVNIGEFAALYFEDQLTMQYQIQEMLRIEKIFEHQGIQDELDVYNPLIPNGCNLKATFMLEYADLTERKKALARLIGIEKSLYMQVEGFDKVYAIANEDLPRETEEKTSAVHFVRFELTNEMISAIKQGIILLAGIDHPQYHELSVITESVHQSLIGDLH